MPPSPLFLGPPAPPKANNWVLHALLVRLREDPPQLMHSPSPTSSSFALPLASEGPSSPSPYERRADGGWGGKGAEGEVDRRTSPRREIQRAGLPFVFGGFGLGLASGQTIGAMATGPQVDPSRGEQGKRGRTRRMQVYWTDAGEGAWG